MQVQQARHILRTQLDSYSDSPREDADRLLMVLLGFSKALLFSQADTLLTDQQQAQLRTWLHRRQQGEPVAYITGQQGFWTLDLSVSDATLIPRPETELLVELALERLPINQSCQVLDLGTGTGAVALAIQSERPKAQITAVDLSQEALQVARKNAYHLNFSVRFLQGSWFEPLVPTLFDLIVSNPPYIDAQDVHLFQGDVRFEPRSALIAAEHGLADLAHLIQTAPSYLKKGGWLLLEHGYQQGSCVHQLFNAHDYRAVVSVRDFAGCQRVTLGRYLDQD